MGTVCWIPKTGTDGSVEILIGHQNYKKLVSRNNVLILHRNNGTSGNTKIHGPGPGRACLEAGGGARAFLDNHRAMKNPPSDCKNWRRTPGAGESAGMDHGDWDIWGGG